MNQSNNAINSALGQPVLADTNTIGMRLPDPPSSNHGEWPEPTEIKCELLPVPPFPNELIPEAFRAHVMDIAYRRQVPLSFPACGVMSVAGSIIGAGCGIKPKRNDDWLVVPNLWGGIIASPGKLKSAILSDVIAPLSRLETVSREQYEAALATFGVDTAEHDKRKQALLDFMKKAAKDERQTKTRTGRKRDQLSNMDELKYALLELKPPHQPTHRRFKTNDATIEMVHQLLSTNPRGLLITRDELTGWLSSLDREDRKQDRAFYLESWNGTGSFTYDRIGRGSVFVGSLCVSIFGGIQPDKLREYLYASMRGGEDDGLQQRFQMLVYPDDVEWCYVDEPPDPIAKKQAHATFDTLAAADFTKFGAVLDENETIPYFRFSDSSQEFFKDWLIDLERNKLSQNDEPIIVEHLSKYRSLMPSVALIDHLAKSANGNLSKDISLESAERAAAWCDFLELHARRIYGLVARARFKAAINLADKLRKGKLSDGFTARDVYLHGWSYLSTADETQAALNELVLHNWLREYPGERTVRYSVNPRIFA